jgi:prepilin-type N-terminal cleavage/methylation domain-containing protein
MTNVFRSRAGFTAIEILIVMIIIGAVAAVAIPRLRGSQEKMGVRSSRAAVTTLVAKARGIAVQRGCPATLHLRSTGRVWVTVCRLRAAGGTLDTVGTIEDLGARYAITMTPSVDSVRFNPRGMNAMMVPVTVRFTAGTESDSVRVNVVGKVVR